MRTIDRNNEQQTKAVNEPDKIKAIIAKNNNFPVSSLLENNNSKDDMTAPCKPKNDGSEAKLENPLDAEDFENNKLEYACSPIKNCGIQAKIQTNKIIKNNRLGKP